MVILVFALTEVAGCTANNENAASPVIAPVKIIDLFMKSPLGHIICQKGKLCQFHGLFQMFHVKHQWKHKAGNEFRTRCLLLLDSTNVT